MTDTGLLLTLAAGALAGAIVQAVSGFGFAIIAAPVFLWAMNSPSAVPVLVALHVVQSAMLVPRVWRQAPPRLLGALALGAVIGCPIGLLVFLQLDVRTIKLTIGVLILAITSLLIAREFARPDQHGQASADPSPWSTGLTGAISGAMTAVLVMPGPPLMLHLAHVRLPKTAARALSLTFFGMCYVGVLALAVGAGSMDAGSWRLVGLLTPVVVIGTLVGQRLVPLFTEEQFRHAILILLIAAGIGALLSSL